MLIDLEKLVGKYCITTQDGQLLYNRIAPELRRGHRVELNFLGVEAYASPFLNAAIGQLVSKFRPERLNKLLSITNLGHEGEETLRIVLDNARQYQANRRVRSAYRAIFDESQRSE